MIDETSACGGDAQIPCFLCLAYLSVTYIGSGQMSLLTPLEILLAVIWSFLFLGEQLALAHIAGGVLILASALLAIQRLNLTWRCPRWRTWFRV